MHVDNSCNRVLQKTKCDRVVQEMRHHHHSCAAEQTELLCQLDAAVTMGKASLHDCRQGGRHEAKAVKKKLRLQQIQAGERERHMARRLDVVLHTNHSLRKQIASLRDNVLHDREHCNNLLQRHTATVEAAIQCTNNLQLENQTKLARRSIKQKVDSSSKPCQVRTMGSRIYMLHQHGTPAALTSPVMYFCKIIWSSAGNRAMLQQQPQGPLSAIWSPSHLSDYSFHMRPCSTKSSLKGVHFAM